MHNPQLIAVCQPELASLLARELQEIGLDAVQDKRPRVIFPGGLREAYTACIWSRIANRILWPIATFSSKDTDELYEGALSIRWIDHLDPEGTLAIDANVRSSEINHSGFAGLRVKDAIVDQLLDETGFRPNVDKERPDLRIHVDIFKDEATVSIDLSGESLHRRGYRRDGAMAPLKETLAASLLYRAGWPEIAKNGGSLVDPMCGSGTLAIEAALMAGDVAPALRREYFGFTGWQRHDKPLFDELMKEARDRASDGAKTMPAIFGRDSDGRAVQDAHKNADRAIVSHHVTFIQQRFEDFRGLKDEHTETGLVITNPPYGERLGDSHELRDLYASFGDYLKEHFAGWQAAVITGEKALAQTIGLRAHKRNSVKNGRIACEFLLFDIRATGTRKEVRAEVIAADSSHPLSAGAEMVQNRIKKNLKHIRKWAKRNDVSCYRIYDKDIPEYAAAIDLYGEHVHIQEYAPPASVDEAKAARRLDEVLQGAGRALFDTLDIDPNNIHVKRRERKRGASQYEKFDGRGDFLEVTESGHTFLVNLTDYLDTGLFLDHRKTRKLVGELADGRDFLNLFAYTGAATVYAAKGGASSTTTVDMSNTYLDWARDNLEANNIYGRNHRIERADCMAWVTSCDRRFGLIFLDPPTFSNSKKMDKTFEVQRDHIELIANTARLLDENGILIFSNNRRDFKMDQEALSDWNIEALSPKTIDEDFKRNPRIHNCWKITRRA